MPKHSPLRPQFPLFQTPIDLAQGYWKRLLKKGDTVIDATCGNGHDTAALAKMLEDLGGGNVIALDVQNAALEATKTLCTEWFEPASKVRIELLLQSHASFPEKLLPSSVALIVYNLGYLPGGDKSVTTLTPSTLQSIESVLSLLREGGALSVTCYPGHEEGAREETNILEYVQKLSPDQWSCCHHRWINRRTAPSLLLIQKRT